MTGDELRAFRELLDLSQQQLADVVGVNRGTISSWERGDDPVPAWGANVVRWFALEDFRPKSWPLYSNRAPNGRARPPRKLR